MKFSVYVIYELLMRAQEFDPGIGDYQSYKKNKCRYFSDYHQGVF